MAFPSKYSIDWQCICLLLYTLYPIAAGATKAQVLAKILDNGWFQIADEDEKPYPSAWDRGSYEPRWMTLIAYARNHAKDFGYISNEAVNNWKITDAGKDQVERLISKSAAHEIEVGKCFLWSSEFKTILDPTYQPSKEDIKRPLGIYKDTNPLAGLI